ncbi:MAG TPA: VCBS repeat-containing protein [Usitatibacter sp.]|nr:VCBS repeat-containing protein [Usitatibacter sp.]
MLAAAFASLTAAAQTRLYLQSDPGDNAGGGATATFTAPTDSFAVTAQSQNHFGISVGSSGELAAVDLSLPDTSMFGSGPHEGATTYQPGSSVVGISARLGWGGSCYPVTGRFVVLSVAYDSNGRVSSLAADFEQHCSGIGPALWGELRFNSAVPFSSERPAGWTTPDPYTFEGRTGLAPNGAIVESAPTTIYGINAPAPISIINGEYSVNGGPYTTAAGTVNNKDTIRVRRASPTSAGASASATVNTGNFGGTFTLVAFTPGVPQTGFVVDGADLSLFAQPGDWRFTNYIQDNGVSVGANRGSDTVFVQAFPPTNSSVSAGAYESAIFIGNNAAPSILMSTALSECGSSNGGRFAILEIDIAQQKLAMDFEVTCNSGPPMFGEVRVNSAIPFNFQVTTADSTPDPMAFISPGLVRGGTTVTSNSTRIYGVNAPVPISISGAGEYSLNGGAFTSQPGTASELDEIQVRVKASSVPGATREAVLDAGGVAVHFPVATYGPGQLVTGMAYQSAPGDFIGGGKSRTLPVPASYVTGTSYDGTGASVVVASADGQYYTLQVNAPNSTALAPGIYENAQQFGGDPSRPVFSFDGEGHGCNLGYGRFVVYEFSRNSDESLVSLAVDFEQRCDTADAPALRGQIRFNSRFPLSPLLTVTRPRDLDGDGRDDIVWQNTDGRAAVWTMNGLAPTASAEILGPGSGWVATNQADFDADGKTDIVWQHPDGRMAIWLMNGTVPVAGQQLLNSGGGWHVSQVADLNGDGNADLVFANSNGSVAVWTMDGTTMTGGGTILGPGTGWTVAFTGDFDGDGKADLLWTHPDGRAAIWIMNGASITSTRQILNAGSGWTPVQVADLNGDGRSDIVWQNTDGRAAAWVMNGAAIFDSRDILAAGTGWTVAGAADFDADGKADLVLRHPDGRAAIWLMDGTLPTTTTQILEPGTGWATQRLVDLDGDGRCDIVWRHTDGRYAAWLMRGTTMLSGSGILDPGTGWNALP